MEYLYSILSILLIYMALVSGLALAVSYCGVFVLHFAGLFAIGAYSYSIIVRALGEYSFPLALLVGIAINVGLSLGLTRLILHFSEPEEYILLSVCLQFVLRGVYSNWYSLTGGHDGLTNIPYPNILGLRLASHSSLLILVSFCSILCIVIMWMLSRSAFGLALRTIREDPEAAESIGNSVARLKSLSMLIAAIIAAIMGSVYGAMHRYIGPDRGFDIQDSIFLFSMASLGGGQSIFGPLVITAVFVILTEALNIAGLPGAWREVAYGSILVAFVILRPEKFHREPSH